MNLLIVDDQSTVVDGLLNGIDWNACGIDNTYGAYSAAQAQYILQREKIDIMLSDIEMPNESGLSLVSWIRREKMEVCVIMLTSHAEFSYAQESVRLNVFEYILQPAPYAKIEEAVKRAVTAVSQERNEHRLIEYGEEYVRRKRMLTAAALWTWLAGTQNDAEIQRLAGEGLLPGKSETAYLCSMRILRWNTAEKWEPALLEFALQNILDEIFLPIGQKTLVNSLRLGEYVLLIWSGKRALSTDSLRQQLQFFQWVCQRNLQFDAAVYLCRFEAENAQGLWEKLMNMHVDNVSHQAGVFLLNKGAKQDEIPLFLPQMQEWTEYLKGEYPERVKNEAFALLDELIAQKRMTAQILHGFYQDYLQILFTATEGDRSFWNELFDQSENGEIYRKAPFSVENMKKLILISIQHMAEKAETPEYELQQKIDQYIDAHMEEEIHRADIAGYVHMSPDYLNRVFKQMTGKALKEYVIFRKMEMARRLLRTTRLPVGIVASRVGVAPISHFSAAYKKMYGCTPSQERKEEGR